MGSLLPGEYFREQGTRDTGIQVYAATGVVALPTGAAARVVALERSFATRIMPSPIHGVGVFAVRRFQKGARVFEDLDLEKEAPASGYIPSSAIEALPANVRARVADYFGEKNADGELFVPSGGFHQMPVY